VQRPALDQGELAGTVGTPAKAGGLAPLAAAGSLGGLGSLLTASGLWLRRRRL
jgi:hypothetical protein